MAEQKGSTPSRQMQITQAIQKAVDLHQAGRLREAAALCQVIIDVDPRQVSVLRLMGHIALEAGTPDVALDSFNRALSIAPNAPGMQTDLGRALLDLGKYTEAASAFRKALVASPDDTRSHIGLAAAYLNLNNPAEALQQYRKVLTLRPDNKLAEHMVSALTGEPLAEGATSYVPILFDGYADTFDQHLDALGYHIPQMLREALEPFGGDTGFASALDLGCGTGLVGVAIKDIATAVDGLDIAAGMIEQAGAKQVYRHLQVGDTVEVLSADPLFSGPYDLVTSADVFIYVGPLEATFAAVRGRMAPSGIFAFSVEEAADGAGSTVRASGRFAHSPDYIAGLAATHGFVQRARIDLPIRTELKRPIPGQIYVLQLT